MRNFLNKLLEETIEIIKGVAPPILAFLFFVGVASILFNVLDFIF